MAGRSASTRPPGDVSRSRSHHRPRPRSSSSRARRAGLADQWATHDDGSRGWSQTSSTNPLVDAAPSGREGDAEFDDANKPGRSPARPNSTGSVASAASGGGSPVNNMDGRKDQGPGLIRTGLGRWNAGDATVDSPGIGVADIRDREPSMPASGRRKCPSWSVSRMASVTGEGEALTPTPTTGLLALTATFRVWRRRATGGRGRIRRRVVHPKPKGSVALRPSPTGRCRARIAGTVRAKPCHGRPGHPAGVGHGSVRRHGVEATGRGGPFLDGSLRGREERFM